MRQAPLYQMNRQDGQCRTITFADLQIGLVGVLDVEVFGCAPVADKTCGVDFGIGLQFGNLRIRQSGKTGVVAAVIINFTFNQKMTKAADQGRNRADHRGAKHNADDGNPGAVFVGPKVFLRKTRNDVHAPVTSSLTMRPSSMRRIRSALRAMLGSWVMMMTVC